MPPELRAGTFREACLEIEVDRKGNPVTLIGLFAPGEGGQPAMLLSPAPGRPLRDARALLVLTGEAE